MFVQKDSQRQREDCGERIAEHSVINPTFMLYFGAKINNGQSTRSMHVTTIFFKAKKAQILFLVFFLLHYTRDGLSNVTVVLVDCHCHNHMADTFCTQVLHQKHGR